MGNDESVEEEKSGASSSRLCRVLDGSVSIGDKISRTRNNRKK
jgi:hypothetical protein